MKAPEQSSLNPYEGNILVTGLGPLLSRIEVLKLLTELPATPSNMDQVPHHVTKHMLMEVRDFYFPEQECFELHETIDLMVRQGYRYRDPRKAQTWAMVSGEQSCSKMARAPAFGAAAEGLSGTGKTAAILRCLGSYPQQVFHHASFPQLVGGHNQVVWLSVDVPASGRATDLAASLMMEFDRVTGGIRFQSALLRQRRDGMRMLDEWRQVANSHFLGILHLDEVQNFFKLSALRQRSRRAGSPDAHELSIVEDQALRWVLTLMNTWQIPVIVSGTPDGIHALTRRMSNLGRIVTSGFHSIPFVL